MPRVARPESSVSRVIAHVDMDCFYVQVEQRRRPTLRGHPTAVVQYNSWKGGGLIAVGYEARNFGVKRSMRGDEAKEVCPDIQLVQVPVARGKADLSIYRNAGSEVISILSQKGRCERASIDEVYLDLSEAASKMLSDNPPDRLESISEEALKSHVLGFHLDGANSRDHVREWFIMSDADHRDKLLACGALIVAELRLEVLKETEFTCSAGIAHNKMLAKLASGMNKPAQQTIVPFSCVKEVLEPLTIKKMKQLGGKLGTSLQDDLGVNTVGDLLQFSEAKLQERYGINTGTWLWNIARGICGEEVEHRLLPKSHGSGKAFPGSQALKTLSSVQKWLNDLCEELNERIVSDFEQNKRIAHTLTLHSSAYMLNVSESLKKFPSKSCPLRYGILKIQEDVLKLFSAGLREFVGIHNVKATGNKNHEWAITGLSVSASRIVERPSGTHSIMKYFHIEDQTSTPTNEPQVISEQDAISSSTGNGSSERLHLVDPQSYTYEDEVRTEHDMLTHGREMDIFKARLKQQEDVTGEFFLMSSSPGVGLRTSLRQSNMDFRQPGLKSDKHKRKLENLRGTPSILRFFQSQSSCSVPEQLHDQGIGSSSSDIEANGCPEGIRGKFLEENQHPNTRGVATSRSHLGQIEFRSDAWIYKKDEIDPTVLNELPHEIQAEVRAWLQPQKRANTEKKGSRIVHYFSPSTSS